MACQKPWIAFFIQKDSKSHPLGNLDCCVCPYSLKRWEPKQVLVWYQIFVFNTPVLALISNRCIIGNNYPKGCPVLMIYLRITLCSASIDRSEDQPVALTTSCLSVRSSHCHHTAGISLAFSTNLFDGQVKSQGFPCKSLSKDLVQKWTNFVTVLSLLKKRHI